MLKYEKHIEIEISDEDVREIIDNCIDSLYDKETAVRYALNHHRVIRAEDWDIDQIQLFVDKFDDIVKDISSMMKKKWVEPDIMELSLTPVKVKYEMKYPCDNCIHNTDGSKCYMSYECEECDIKCDKYLKLNLLGE